MVFDTYAVAGVFFHRQPIYSNLLCMMSKQSPLFVSLVEENTNEGVSLGDNSICVRSLTVSLCSGCACKYNRIGNNKNAMQKRRFMKGLNQKNSMF